MTARTFPVAPDDAPAIAWQERGLLALAGLFLLVNAVALELVRPNTGAFVSWVVWGLCAGVGHLLLSRALPSRDAFLFPLAMFLSGWGLVLIARLFPFFADRQTLWLVVGLAGLAFAACTPYLLHLLRAYRYTLLLVGVALLLSTIVLGRNPSGSSTAPQLWLGVAGVFFQPSEALKVILVAFLASYLAEHAPNMRFASPSFLRSGRIFWLSPRLLGPVLLMWGVCVVVLVWQRDLGTAFLFFGVFLCLLYVASGQWWVLLSGASLLLVAGAVAYRLFAVVRLRIDIWLNAWAEADGRAYQVVQSLMAFGAGGIGGQGIGQGAPLYIPVVHSDFALSALAEEWGLLGVLVVCFALLLYLWRGLRVALAQQNRPFYALLAVGLVALIGVQSLMIMGGVLKVLPLTGVTLPFVSYGGSSLLMCFVVTGILLRLSAQKTT